MQLVRDLRTPILVPPSAWKKNEKKRLGSLHKEEQNVSGVQASFIWIIRLRAEHHEARYKACIWQVAVKETIPHSQQLGASLTGSDTRNAGSWKTTY